MENQELLKEIKEIILPLIGKIDALETKIANIEKEVKTTNLILEDIKKSVSILDFMQELLIEYQKTKN